MNRILTALFVLCLIMSGCKEQRQTSPIVARVNNSSLTLEEVKKRLSIDETGGINKGHFENYVYRWIDSEVIYQSAMAEKVDNLIQIQNELERLRRDFIIGYYIDSKLNMPQSIDEEDISKYYQEHQDDFIRDFAEYRYFFLICKDRKIAQALKVELRGGKTFAEISAGHYPDEVLNQIWDSEPVRFEQVIQPLQKSIGQRATGDIYGPVAAQGRHVIYQLVEKHDAGSTRDLEIAKELITQRLKERWYRESYQSLMVSLKSNKKIDLNLDILEQDSVDN